MWFITFIVLVCMKLIYLLYPVEALLLKTVAAKNYLIYEGNSISKLQIKVATYVFELSAGHCHR